MGSGTGAVVAFPPAATHGSHGEGRYYRPELDAIRFFLFLGVLAHHAIRAPMNQSWAHRPGLAHMVLLVRGASGFSLSFFFFLSSYLIASLLRAEQARSGTLDLRRFYIRRILRLWPLYLGYLALVCALSIVVPELAIQPRALLAFLCFSGNWYWFFHGALPGLVVFHLWSISVEEQFYLVFPLAAKALSLGRLQQVSIALCVLSLATTFFAVTIQDTVIQVWVSSASECIFFASGILFALHSSFREHLESLPRALGGIAAGLALWAFAQASGVNNPLSVLQPWSATLAFAGADIGCALILWGTLRFPLALLPKPLVYLGRIAYGLYIFHLLVLWAVDHYLAPHIHTPGLAVLIDLVLTIVVAALSYEFFEKPFLRLKYRFEVVHSRAA